MRNKNQLILATCIILFGLMLLVANIFDVSIWRFIWPLGLIVIGALLILRQRSLTSVAITNFAFVRNIKRFGDWEFDTQEYLHFSADLNLDFTNVTIPDGEYYWRLYGFVHDLHLTVPKHVGLAVTTHAIVTEKKIDCESEDYIFMPFEWKTENYDAISKKLHLEAYGFVVEVRIKEEI